jgi:hypothetical protein
MRLPRWNSFVGGFGTAVLLFVVVFAWTQFEMQGGISADSPDRQMELRAMGPLGGGKGCTYTVKLIDSGKDSVLRWVSLTFPSNVSTYGLREGGGDIQWDSGGQYVDLKMAGDPIIRLWVPKRG